MMVKYLQTSRQHVQTLIRIESRIVKKYHIKDFNELKLNK